MSAQIQLTEAEINLIAANRQAAEAQKIANDALKAQRAAEKEIEAQKELAEKVKRIELMNSYVSKLIEADTTGNFTVRYDDVKGIDLRRAVACFVIDGRVQEVDVNEVFKSSGRYRSYGTGVFQYTVSGAFTDYKSRNYKSVKSLVKKVAEFIEIAEAVAARKDRALNLVKVTMAELKKQHPTAKITAYEPNNWNSMHSKYYYTYQVETTAGAVSFTSSYDKDELVISVHNYQAKTTEVKAEIANLILAG